MTFHSITLQLPDKLYQKLKQRSQQTNRSVEEELLNAIALDLPVLPVVETGELSAYNQVLEFLISGPTAAEIAQFQLSDEARQRAGFLVAKERDQELTASETRELDFYVELGDFLGILRARALLRLQNEKG